MNSYAALDLLQYLCKLFTNTLLWNDFKEKFFFIIFTTSRSFWLNKLMLFFFGSHLEYFLDNMPDDILNAIKQLTLINNTCIGNKMSCEVLSGKCT